jgi:hypothetical protein
MRGTQRPVSALWYIDPQRSLDALDEACYSPLYDYPPDEEPASLCPIIDFGPVARTDTESYSPIVLIGYVGLRAAFSVWLLPSRVS